MCFTTDPQSFGMHKKFLIGFCCINISLYSNAFECFLNNWILYKYLLNIAHLVGYYISHMRWDCRDGNRMLPAWKDLQILLQLFFFFTIFKPQLFEYSRIGMWCVDSYYGIWRHFFISISTETEQTLARDVLLLLTLDVDVFHHFTALCQV